MQAIHSPAEFVTSLLVIVINCDSFHVMRKKVPLSTLYTVHVSGIECFTVTNQINRVMRDKCHFASILRVVKLIIVTPLQRMSYKYSNEHLNDKKHPLLML